MQRTRQWPRLEFTLLKWHLKPIRVRSGPHDFQVICCGTDGIKKKKTIFLSQVRNNFQEVSRIDWDLAFSNSLRMQLSWLCCLRPFAHLSQLSWIYWHHLLLPFHIAVWCPDPAPLPSRAGQSEQSRGRLSQRFAPELCPCPAEASQAFLWGINIHPIHPFSISSH